MDDLTRRLDQYLQDVNRLRARVTDMTADQLRSRPVAGRWSTLELVCHIVDSDGIHADRMKRIIAEDEPTLPYAHEGLWVERLASHDRDVEEELALLRLTRSQMARILRTVPSTAFTRTGNHTTDGSFTLQKMFERATNHLLHHLTFVDEKRAALGLPTVE